MLADLDRTIAAQASAAGSAERALIRVSGTDARSLVESVFEPDDQDAWQRARLPRQHAGMVWLESLQLPVRGHALLWPGVRSYTGQPMVELQLPGSPPLVELVLQSLFKVGVRPARRGEFTLRSFLAGRLDLVQAEAVLAVIDAEDSVQLRQALQQLAGGLSGKLFAVRATLIDLLADLEAGLDFVDEDIEFVTADQLVQRLDQCRQTVVHLSQQATRRMDARERHLVVLAGLPNAGKSTLFNRLTGEESALVSTVPGTTRDYLAAMVRWEGVDIELIDTAGWELAADEIMGTAQQLRQDRLDAADVIVWCTAADLDAAGQRENATRLRETRERHPQVLEIHSRADLAPDHLPSIGDPSGLLVSGETGQGVDLLQQIVLNSLSSRQNVDAELVGSTAARCFHSLQSVDAALASAMAGVEARIGDELVAFDLRSALDALGEILGQVYSDDILGRIFSRFCIGK